MSMIAGVGVSVQGAGCVELVLALLVSVAVVGIADVGCVALSGTSVDCV